MPQNIMTEAKVKKIAEDVAEKKMETILKKMNEQGKILDRLNRALLGEEGVPNEETLAHRARVAHTFATANAPLIDDLAEMQKWYTRWSTPNPGCKESNFQKMGKLIKLQDNVTWLLGLIGVVSIFNAIPVVKWIAELIT